MSFTSSRLYAVNERGLPSLMEVLTPFFETIYPALLEMADQIVVKANVGTGEVSASFVSQGKVYSLSAASGFHPFVASSRIRILCRMSIVPTDISQKGKMTVALNGHPLNIDVEISVADGRESLLLIPQLEPIIPN